MSTGQGFLGNNMFAYCLNNPLALHDPNGLIGTDGINTKFCHKTIYDGCGSVLLMIGVFVLPPIIQKGAQFTEQVLSSVKSEIYAFSKELRVALKQAKRSMPQVHHIVPKNVFSGRSEETKDQIREIHKMLSLANINRFIDPMNLMLVSAGTHASLHTDAYIERVYGYIKATDGSKEQIYWALFLLRLEIAGQDSYAIGY